MRRSCFTAAVLPALLLLSQVAEAQQPERQRNANRNTSAQGGMTLPGPDGEAALRVNKDAPSEVRAGEPFDYTITVENVSNSSVRDVVVVEEVEGLEVRDTQTPTDANQQNRRQQRQNDQDNAQNQNRQNRNQANNNQQNQQNNRQRAAQQRDRSDQQSGSQNDRQNQGNRQNQAGNQNQRNRQQGQNQQAQNQQGQQGQNQQGQVKQEGNTVRYEIGKLDAGESKTLTVSAVANEGDQAKSCMWVDFKPTICTTIAVVQPDFRLVGRLLFDREIETEADIKGIYNCDRVWLDMAVTSTGDAATPEGQATVTLPEGLTTEDGKNEIQVDLGRIEPNQTVRKELPLKLDPQKAGDEVAIQARAEAGDLNAEVNLPAVKVLDPQLQVSVDAPEQAYIDRPVEINITVENPGEDPVLDTVVRIQGPAGVENFRIQGGEGARAGRDGTFNLGRLDGGQSRDFTVTMQANQPSDANVKVTAQGYCVQAEEQQAQIAMRGIPAVLIEVVDKVDPVPVGENTSYEIAVKNQGTQRDTNIQLRATLPDSMDFVRGDGETKVTANGKQIEFGQLKELAPGDIVSWTVQVKANKADRARLRVELESDATDEPIIEEEPTTLYGDSPQGDQQGQSGNQNRNQGNSGNNEGNN